MGCFGFCNVVRRQQIGLKIRFCSANSTLCLRGILTIDIKHLCINSKSKSFEPRSTRRAQRKRKALFCVLRGSNSRPAKPTRLHSIAEAAVEPGGEMGGAAQVGPPGWGRHPLSGGRRSMMIFTQTTKKFAPVV